MLKAFMFDVEGVLINLEHYRYVCWKSILSQHNILLNDKLWKEAYGHKRMEVANILLKKTKLSQNEITSICNETNSLFVSLVEKGISSKALYAGIKNLLRTIKQKHYLLIANSSSQNVDILLKKTNIYKEFDYVTNYDNLKGFSVDEKATLTPPVMAMNKLKLLGNECIAFDDSPQNIDILNKLNIFTIGITNYQDKKSFNSKMIYNSSQNINYEEVTFNYYKKYDSN